MNVSVRAFGRMREYLGQEAHVANLRAGSTLRDLMEFIDAQWGQELPAYIWNRQEKRFCSSVVCAIDKKAVTDLNTLLQDMQEVGLHQVMTGG